MGNFVLNLKNMTVMYSHQMQCMPQHVAYLFLKNISFSYRRCIWCPFQCCVLAYFLFLDQSSAITLVLKKWKLSRKLWLAIENLNRCGDFVVLIPHGSSNQNKHISPCELDTCLRKRIEEIKALVF